MSYVKKHPLFILFFLGLLLRLVLMFVDFSFDVHNHISWAQDLWNRGPSNFYLTPSKEVYATLYPNYPPFALYIFYVTYPITQILYDICWWLNLHVPLFPSKLIFIIQERYFLAGVMKLPAIFADMGIAWMSYLFANKLLTQHQLDRKVLLLAPSLVLFNPAFFYNSAFWGQIDAIPIFLVLTSTYLAMYSKRYFMSGLLFISALLVKPTAIVFLPFYALFFINKFGFVKSLKVFLASNIVFIVSLFPFLGKKSNILIPYSTYFHSIIEAQSLAFVTNGAYNLWAFTRFDGVMDSDIFLLNMTYRTWGYIFLSIALLIIMKIYLKKHNLFYSTFLSAFAFFLFATKMHERYTLLILPFLLLAALTERKLLKWFYGLSFLSFINLYRSWPVPRVEFLFELLKSPAVYLALSVINIVIFFHLLTQYSSRMPSKSA
ncbi:hypothetical protein KBD09_00990 [Candidatus Woesebacteria bacterium]|nr:hypothetical protein [Candidatus Woesebacteria bacterium]